MVTSDLAELPILLEARVQTEILGGTLSPLAGSLPDLTGSMSRLTGSRPELAGTLSTVVVQLTAKRGSSSQAATNRSNNSSAV